MKTKLEIIAELKLEHPTIREGSDEIGYTELSEADYESKIVDWAEHLYSETEKAKNAITDAENTAAQIATEKAALLAKLGITEEEARLLLGGN